MIEPNMTAVRRLARKYGITGAILPSSQEHKKLMIQTPAGAWVHFGDNRYQDFTTHGDLRRRLSYCARAGAIRNEAGKLTDNDPESANFYAMRLLWYCTP